MSKNNIAGQSVSKTETLSTLVVKNTTSPTEKNEYSSMNYVLICPVTEILSLNIDKNVRIGYGHEDSGKKETAIHQQIRESFRDDPDRFIQRHTGFVVICDEIEVGSPRDYGKNEVKLTNASLINGAQTQQILKDFFYDNSEDSNLDEYKNVNIRIEVIVEKNKEQQGEIKVARNSTVNVTDLSIFGEKGVFKNLGASMVNHNADWKLSIKETDKNLNTQQVLQVVRLFLNDDMVESDPSQRNIVKSYRNRAQVLKDFAKMHDTNTSSEVYNFYVDFAPLAYEEYLKWTHDPDWLKFYKKSENSKRIGRYSTKTKEFALSWALVCPILYGLRDFVVEDSKGWKMKYPSGFDKEDYMEKAFEIFKKDCDYVPQEFGKQEGTYLKLLRYASRY